MAKRKKMSLAKSLKLDEGIATNAARGFNNMVSTAKDAVTPLVPGGSALRQADEMSLYSNETDPIKRALQTATGPIGQAAGAVAKGVGKMFGGSDHQQSQPQQGIMTPERQQMVADLVRRHGPKALEYLQKAGGNLPQAAGQTAAQPAAIPPAAGQVAQGVTAPPPAGPAMSAANGLPANADSSPPALPNTAERSQAGSARQQQLAAANQQSKPPPGPKPVR